MSTNPLRPNLNRAKQIKSDKEDLKQSVSLFDIDYAIMSYLEETVLPELDDNGKALKIPVIYGNSERWNGARRQGVYRDTHGKLQLPLMMLRRTSVAKNEAMPMLNRHLSYQGVTKWSKDNRYTRFSLLGKTITPKYEIYNITMPDYVEINYECMGWTNYTEHLNAVIESLTFASDEYWGDKQKFKFNTTITDYNVVNEVGEGTERINRVEFTLNVKAYLLPEKFDGESTIKKSMSIKRVVVSTETDVTGNGRLEGMLTTPSPYYDNKDLIDFLSLNNTKSKRIVSGDIDTNYVGKIGKQTISLTGIKLIKTPAQLSSVITGGLTIANETYDIKVYINGVRYYQTSHFTVSIGMYIHFDPTLLSFSISTGDEIVITGKFIDL
jgi:hypothetical protein